MSVGIGADFAATALSGSLIAALAVALIAGVVSFASPCVVPLVPGYLGYVSGIAGATTERRGSRPRLLLGTLLFVAGFAAVFVVLGVAVTSVGVALAGVTDTVLRVMGVLVILLGFAFMGAVPFLQQERRIHVSPRAGLVGAPLLGVTFGLGWTPCIGPTLGAVYTLALDDATLARGTALAVAYSIGLGLPFVLIALFAERSGAMLGWLRRHRLALMRVGGGMLIVLGVMLVTGLWMRFTDVLQGWVDSFGVAV